MEASIGVEEAKAKKAYIFYHMHEADSLKYFVRTHDSKKSESVPVHLAFGPLNHNDSENEMEICREMFQVLREAADLQPFLEMSWEMTVNRKMILSIEVAHLVHEDGEKSEETEDTEDSEDAEDAEDAEEK